MQEFDVEAESRPPFEINSPTLGGEIKVYMERHEHAVGELIRHGDERAGAEASQKWARVFDGLLCSLFCAIRPKIGDEKTWESLSLAAVGSYGRGNFCFRSDLDVRILCKQPKKAAEIAEAILYPLWDAGLEIGHQVVTVSDTLALAKKDLPTATTLLDWRHLAGNSEDGKKLKAKAFESIFSTKNVPRFLEEMSEQAVLRSERFGDSVYLLEPDVKNGQGGLRDLDIVGWTAQARWRAKDMKELLDIGVLVSAEYEQLADAAMFLARVRNVLHFHSPRRSERLSYEAQETVAENMGFGKGGAACEQMMSDYYRHARVIQNTRETLLRRAEPPQKIASKEKPLTDGIALSGSQIILTDPSRLEEEPVLMLRAYWEAVHRDARIEARSRDAICRALTHEDVCKRLRENPEAARLFRRLVRQPRTVKFKSNSTLSEFHDVGLLLAMVPEFLPVVGRVHHDVYHVYTVDVHSIAAVDRLRKFCRGELSTQHPLASRLAAEIARPQVLFMAALLHDIGKDVGGLSHSERGAEFCRGILVRLGVQEHDIVEVQNLVLKHLRMYHVASRRDIDDPQTIEDFRGEVHGPEGLKELYLLTLCDVATTSPTALSSWKARMMEELYVSTLRSFDDQPSHTEERAEKLRTVTRELCPEKGERDFLDHFLLDISDRYMYANEPQQIVGHARLARQSERRRFMVEMVGVRSPYVELGFILDDKSGALADITASLAANRLRVIGAQLYAWVDRNGRKRVLDIFWVVGGRQSNSVEKQLPKLRKDLEGLLSGEVDAESLLVKTRKNRMPVRPTPDVPITIQFDNRCSERFTVIEVLAEDRTGMLYRLAKTLRDAQIEVAVAKINTEGNRVLDVFYVLDRNGKKLVDETQMAELSAQLRAAIPRAVTN